jgi:hypothetical protein
VAPYKAQTDRVLQESCRDLCSPGHSSILEKEGKGGVGVRERLEGPCQLGSIRSEIGLRTVVDPNAELVPSEYVCWISNRHALASCTPVPYRLRMSRYRVGIWRRWGMGESKTTNEADMEAKGKRDLPNTEYGRRRNERGT